MTLSNFIKWVENTNLDHYARYYANEVTSSIVMTSNKIYMFVHPLWMMTTSTLKSCFVFVICFYVVTE